MPQITVRRTWKAKPRATHRIQHRLRYRNRHENRNPITGDGMSNPVVSHNAILSQPRVDSLHATPIWPDELGDLFLQKMLTISRVFRIADLVQLAFEFRKARLRESDAKPDVLQGRCGAEVDPIGRRHHGIFQFWGVRVRTGRWCG
jgi:hypothetical protein